MRISRTIITNPRELFSQSFSITIFVGLAQLFFGVIFGGIYRKGGKTLWGYKKMEFIGFLAGMLVHLACLGLFFILKSGVNQIFRSAFPQIFDSGPVYQIILLALYIGIGLLAMKLIKPIVLARFDKCGANADD